MAENAVQTTLPPPSASPPLGAAPPAVSARQPQPRGPLWAGKKVLTVLASLRLTVILLALSMVIVFCGTLAQVDLSTQTVVKTYFRGFYVWIPFQIFFHPSYHIPGGFPFPGGWLLGCCLLVNLLAAHMVRFKLSWKRSGILLIHGGLIIMMLGELITGLFAVEGNMQIVQGQTTNYVTYANAPELAFVDSQDPTVDNVVVIPTNMLKKTDTISSPDLPVDVKVERYYINAEIQEEESQFPQYKDLRGAAAESLVVEKPEPNGTSKEIATPAIYVAFLAKDTHELLGTYLMSVGLMPQSLKIGDKTYDVALRFKRVYKPYQFKLLEGRHDKYQGSDTPRNFSSKVRLVDKETGENREVLIRMNEPLRYRGEAFYQSHMDTVNRKVPVTGLQVVNNPGWLMPYFSCAIVSLGLLVHFGMSLHTFLNRRSAS